MSKVNKRVQLPAELELAPIVTDHGVLTKATGLVAHLRAVPARFRHYRLFIGLVLAPTAVASLYFGLIAADQYVSEARYIVRSVSNNSNVGGIVSLALGSNASSAAQVVTGGQQFSNAPDETYSINEYILSRDAVARLEKEDGLRQIFSRKQADLINRFPNFYSRNNDENLYQHYREFVDVDVQSESGISVLQVRAFRPKDAQKLALALLKHSEELVNRLNVRARGDAVRFAEDMVHHGEDRVRRIQANITDFRNKELVLDPSKQSDAALDLISRMTADVAADKAQLEHITTMTPASPAIDPLRTRIESIEQQIDQQRSLIVGGDQSMAKKLSQFEQLSLERELAIKMLSSAYASLENARQESQRQQLYLERVVEPNLPDQPLYPKRLLTIGIVFTVCLFFFWIVRGFLISVLEHNP